MNEPEHKGDASFLLFRKGQLVRHMHRGSIKGHVIHCDKHETKIRVPGRWGQGPAVFPTDLLEIVQPKKKQKKKKNPTHPHFASAPLEKLLPGVFVDASGSPLSITCIAAAVIGPEGNVLYYAIENTGTRNITEAESRAIALGDEIRPNGWPIYSDCKRATENHPAINLTWIPRQQNRIAHKIARQGLLG